MTHTFTDANFNIEVVQADKLTLIDFWAPWCPPCLVLGKTVDIIAQEYGDKIKVGKVNADENPEISVNYSVTNLPVILFVKNGQVVDKQVGMVSKSALEKKIKQHM